MVDRQERRQWRRFLFWGVTIGFGFGAIVDVLIFHTIFQTHHILSGFYDPYSYDGLRTNIMLDGIFTFVMIGIMGLGLAMTWRNVNRTGVRYSTQYLVGTIIVGMGAFNVFDGIVTHYVLDLHNVVHGTEQWNPHWVVVSVFLLAIGAVVLHVADGYETT